MAVFGKKQKPEPKRRSGSIAEINAATSAVQEEEGSVPPVQSVPLNTPQDTLPPPPLSGSKKSVYGGFSASTYSEQAAAQRATQSKSNGSADEFSIDHEVGVIYQDSSGRDFYYDDYGTKHYADEVQPDISIPESFEEARHSSSRERFAKEAELAKQKASEQSRTYHQQQQPTPEGAGSYPEATYPPPYNPVPGGQNYDNAAVTQSGYSSEHSSSGQLSGGTPIQHANSEQTVNLKNAEHIENPYAVPSQYINESISRGVVAESFPTIDSTIASLMNSSRSPDDITRAMLGYLMTTLGGEGPDAALKLLDPKNIYAALLVSALQYNLAQNPIDPVALQALWEVKPEVEVKEKIVYKNESAVSPDGKGIWVSLEGYESSSTPIYDGLKKKDKEKASIRQQNLATLDY